MNGRPQCPCGKTLGHPDPCSSDGPPRHRKGQRLAALVADIAVSSLTFGIHVRALK